MSTGIETAVDLIDARREFNAAVLEPLHGFRSTLREGADEFGVAAIVAALEGLFRMLFDAVLDTLLLLFDRVDRVEGAARNASVAADDVHLFEDDRLGSLLSRHDAGGKACAARADDDDIKSLVPVLVGSCGKGRNCSKSGRSGRTKLENIATGSVH